MIFEVISWWMAMMVLITMTKINNRLVYSPVNITKMAKKILIKLNKIIETDEMSLERKEELL